jgi:hypothetical protein
MAGLWGNPEMAKLCGSHAGAMSHTGERHSVAEADISGPCKDVACHFLSSNKQELAMTDFKKRDFVKQNQDIPAVAGRVLRNREEQKSH